MPPKRPAPDTADTDATLMPPPPPATTSSKRRRTTHTHSTPSTTAPPSLFFTIPLPPPYIASSSPEPPSDGQFTAFLHSAITTLPPPTQALYEAAMRSLRPEVTPELTGEMQASVVSAVTGFVVHLPATEWEGDGGEGGFLTRLAHKTVTGRELVTWADTITVALRAFSGTGGSPAPSRASSRESSRSPTPTQSSNHATPSPPTPTRTPAPPSSSTHSHRSSSSGRSATLRASTLARDTQRCVLTAISEPTALEVAHIIPFSVRGAKAAAFWGFLALFLGVEGAERVRGATLQLANGAGSEARGGREAGVGELANCITLEPRAHRYFDAGAIEMVPIPNTGNWSGGYDPSVVSSYDIRLSFPGRSLLPLSRYVYSSSTPPELLSSTQITPGDVITLTTPDPSRWPLPHPLLLQLHALCGRVRRLRAAAGWPVFPYGDGSEEAVGWGEEEEGWEEGGEEQAGVEGLCGEEQGKVADSGMVSPAESVQGWVLSFSPDVDRALGLDGGNKSAKRKFRTALGEEREGGVAAGEDGDKVQERPRKVAVVMDEMGMREEERWGLVKGRRARGV
ncbi:uncharacterized protein H6S33_007085 [Morchella sextelata]|uniref:uncharacterized protein n=1 Tax=Morchella sextelata TaxID=1174677 RepID=UPI001D04F199|nr:uncharacterized protein H6S33_007085 [Morchella sextelata]KAH0604054.1 hypothetical protein H6S33_007085 [Morchella sextelata]